jgi:hypothetical protein
LHELAAQVIRAAVRSGNCERAVPVRIVVERQARSKVIELVKSKSAIARQSESPACKRHFRTATPEVIVENQ